MEKKGSQKKTTTQNKTEEEKPPTTNPPTPNNKNRSTLRNALPQNIFPKKYFSLINGYIFNNNSSVYLCYHIAGENTGPV